MTIIEMAFVLGKFVFRPAFLFILNGLYGLSLIFKINWHAIPARILTEMCYLLLIDRLRGLLSARIVIQLVLADLSFLIILVLGL